MKFNARDDVWIVNSVVQETEISKMSISVIIPTLNAERHIASLLSSLAEQTIQPCEILIIDSSSSDNTLSIAKTYNNVQIITIQLSEFNHGGTRDLGMNHTKGDLVLFLTQDAVPASNTLIEDLIASLLNNPQIAAAYARQIPREDSSPREKLVRAYNYPERSTIHSEEDIPQLGIKTFFFSNVCAVYRRDIYERLGGFEKDLLSNEDMMYAAKAIRNGYQIAYAAEACVVHSHDLAFGEQYERNRIQGYEIARHQDLLKGVSSSREGIQMLMSVSVKLLKQGRLISVFGLLTDCAARYLGSRKGKKQFLKTQSSK